MVKNIILSVILCLLIRGEVSTNTIADDDKWGIDFKLSKHEYILHEPIWLDITLTNISSDSIRTDGLITPNHRQFFIELYDSEGQKVKHTGWKFLIVDSPGNLVLHPGDSDFGSFDIVGLFRSKPGISKYQISTNRFPSIPIGVYTLKVIFEMVESEEVTFEVIEPFGQEIEALHLIEDATRLLVKDNTGPSSKIYKEVVLRFPESVFAEKCFYLAELFLPENWESFRQGTYDKTVLKQKMIDNFPNSGNCSSWLFTVTYDMDEQEQLQYVRKLMEEHPNTKLFKFAKKFEKKILDKSK